MKNLEKNPELKEKMIVFIKDKFNEAKDTIFSGEEIPPMAFISREEKVAVVALNFSDNKSKQASVEALRRICVEIMPDFVVVVSECWAVVRKTDEECSDIIKQHDSLELNPEHIDSLFFIGLTKYDETATGFGKIVSLANGERFLEDIKVGTNTPIVMNILKSWTKKENRKDLI